MRRGLWSNVWDLKGISKVVLNTDMLLNIKVHHGTLSLGVWGGGVLARVLIMQRSNVNTDKSYDSHPSTMYTVLHAQAPPVFQGGLPNLSGHLSKLEKPQVGP